LQADQDDLVRIANTFAQNSLTGIEISTKWEGSLGAPCLMFFQGRDSFFDFSIRGLNRASSTNQALTTPPTLAENRKDGAPRYLFFYHYRISTTRAWRTA
jgi:hypothetical protein